MSVVAQHALLLESVTDRSQTDRQIHSGLVVDDE